MYSLCSERLYRSDYGSANHDNNYNIKGLNMMLNPLFVFLPTSFLTIFPME